MAKQYNDNWRPYTAWQSAGTFIYGLGMTVIVQILRAENLLSLSELMDN